MEPIATLLAQLPAPPADTWDKALAYGPLGVIFVLIVVALVWYGPRMATAHIDLVTALKEKAEKDCDREERTTAAMELQAEASEKLTQTTASIHAEIKQQGELLKTQLPFRCKHPGP